MGSLFVWHSRQIHQTATIASYIFTQWQSLFNMNQNKTILTNILLLIGILLGVVLSTLATWADFESAFYGFTKQAKNPLNGLSCPILIAKDEDQTFSYTIINKTGQTISPTVKAEISTPLAPSTSFEFIELAPGESRTFTWKIGPQNVDLEKFIFAKVLVYSAYPMPDQENTCGLFVLPVRGNGTLYLIVASIVSMLCLGSGGYLGYQASRKMRESRAELFLAALTVVTMTVSFLGLWVQSIFLLAITFLLIVILFSIRLRQNT